MERNTIERPVDQEEAILYLPKSEILNKHMHYGSVYQPNDLYWGVGIEREFYLQSSHTQTVSRQWLLENQKPERYSVRYFQSYKPETVAKAIVEIYRPEEKIHLPILFNAHALYRCDRDGHHQTTYERVPKTNPYHDGTVIFEYLTGYNAGRNVFTQEFERGFCFDGDSIEVTTQNFYKATVEDAIEELMRISNAIIHQANAALAKDGILKEHLPLRWATANHGLAIMWTNPKNLAIFNNGTYQFNLTAPTRLDAAGHIADRPAFVARHKKIIRFFQWLEPLLIAKYGCGDTFSQGRSGNFAHGSLRCAMSRYMGVGTYDTDAMRNGKYLQVEVATAPVGGRDGWYNMFHSNSAYTTLNEIGLDFCFNKHFNHGIEFRIFDWFPELQLYELLRVFVYCMDQALSLPDVPDPRKSRLWNKVCARAIGEGAALKLWNNEKAEFATALGIKLRGFSGIEVWDAVISGVEKWRGRGECSIRLLRPQPGCCGAT